MRPVRFLLALLARLALLSSSLGQQSPAPSVSVTQQDPQAITFIQRAISAMGGAAPRDSQVTGTVSVVVGSSEDTGTIRILTRGLDQTSEEIQSDLLRQKIVYSRGRAGEVEGAESRKSSLELAVTSQCPYFPLPFLVNALNDPAISIQYVAAENVGSTLAHHLRIKKVFPTTPQFAHLTEFSAKDLWIDAATNLPLKLAFHRRAALGASPDAFIEVFFTNYQTVAGALYPFHIDKSLNGTSWLAITVQNVVFNSGLTDTDFSISAR